jgi:hypothetical protein
VLVLADQECLEDAQMNLIRKFVAGGGAVVATESTSLYNNWRERRRDFGLHDLLGVSAPPFHTIRKGEYFPGNAPLRRQAGAGRVVYIPEVQPAIEKPLGARMTNQYWRLPLNSREIVDAVRWAAGNISIEVTGPNTVVAEPMRQGTTKLLLHLLNYDVTRTPSVVNLEVKFGFPKMRSCRRWRCYRLIAPARRCCRTTSKTARRTLPFRIWRLTISP